MDNEITVFENEGTDCSLIVQKLNDAEFADIRVKALMERKPGLLSRLFPSEQDKIISKYKNMSFEAACNNYYRGIVAAYNAQEQVMVKQFESRLKVIISDLDSATQKHCMRNLALLIDRTAQMSQEYTKKFDKRLEELQSIKNERLRLGQEEFMITLIEGLRDTLKKFADDFKNIMNITV